MFTTKLPLIAAVFTPEDRLEKQPGSHVSRLPGEPPTSEAAKAAAIVCGNRMR